MPDEAQALESLQVPEASIGDSIKVTQIETFLVAPRWLFCKVSTDAGVAGWGEPTVEGRMATTRAAVHELGDLLVGANPLRIEDCWQLLTKAGFYRGGPVFSSAVAGLDQALWDIAGKVRGVPIHSLLGGPVRDKLRMYSWVAGDEPAEVSDAIAAQVEGGFTAVKMNASGRFSRLASPVELDQLVARIETAREALGPERDLAVDFHGRVSVADAQRILPLLAPYRLLFVEEPVLPEHLDALTRLVGPVPLATGERLYSRREFLPVLQAGISVAQPDVSHAGGISEMRRIGALAEIFDVPLAPHCPLGPIALAASVQVAFATPNFLIQEQSNGLHYNNGADLWDYLCDRSAFRFVDGCLQNPTGSGLCLEIDEQAVRRADGSGDAWRTPVWRHSDGSLAEW